MKYHYQFVIVVVPVVSSLVLPLSSSTLLLIKLEGLKKLVE